MLTYSLSFFRGLSLQRRDTATSCSGAWPLEYLSTWYENDRQSWAHEFSNHIIVPRLAPAGAKTSMRLWTLWFQERKQLAMQDTNLSCGWIAIHTEPGYKKRLKAKSFIASKKYPVPSVPNTSYIMHSLTHNARILLVKDNYSIRWFKHLLWKLCTYTLKTLYLHAADG